MGAPSLRSVCSIATTKNFCVTHAKRRTKSVTSVYACRGVPRILGKFTLGVFERNANVQRSRYREALTACRTRKERSHPCTNKERRETGRLWECFGVGVVVRVG